MATRTIRIPDDLDNKLAAQAAADGTTIETAIIRALDEAVTRRADETTAGAADTVFTARRELFDRLGDT